MASGSARKPRVSVIVPNFDNGRARSRDGSRDFLHELFSSLERTIGDDPELLEIIVADDGSTDDSLKTARAWASRRVRRGDASATEPPRPSDDSSDEASRRDALDVGGQSPLSAARFGSSASDEPFLRLIELPHSGVLSSVLNRLVREARGEIIARLDGDLVLRTRHWLSELCRLFDADPSVGVITGVQLLPDGRVHAFGDDLWGPRGYRHVGCGAAIDDLPETREVDHAMGCFYAARRAVYERVGPYDEGTLRGQTEEYGVRVRLDGWKVLATRSIVFEHWHVDRAPRANRADRPASLDTSLERFRERHGFDRLAPDLADVRARYLGTPLWWRDHASCEPEPDAAEWTRLASDPALVARLAEETGLLASVLQAASGAALVTQLGCNAGCLGAMLARSGVAYEGIERRTRAIDEAFATAERIGRSLAPTPLVLAVDDLSSIPAIESASRPIVCLFGILERTWNPVGLLREARRIVRDGGVVLVRSHLRVAAIDDPDDRLHPFTANELLALLRHVGTFDVAGFEPRRTATGWMECCLTPATPTSGRGYFAKAWTATSG
jgi:glycosyltransferase involved in cell wall biosynthesis/SAM-dependent methyltransferase